MSDSVFDTRLVDSKGNRFERKELAAQVTMTFEDGTTKIIRISKWEYYKMQILYKFIKAFHIKTEVNYIDDDDNSVHVHILPKKI